jgi:type IV pilus assembly protein PilC
MLFAYAALDAVGRRVRGRLEAEDLDELETRLARMSLFLIRGRPTSVKRWEPWRRLEERVPRRERLWFCFQLRQLAHAGVPLMSALSGLSETLDHPRMKAIVGRLARHLEGGQRFSEALAAHPGCFDPVFVSLIRAGEASGDLSGALERLETRLRREDALVGEVRKMLVYPAMTAVIMLSATGFLLLYLVPQLRVFARNMGQNLPWHARFLFGISDFLTTFWAQGLLVVVAAVGVGIVAWQGSSRLRLAWEAGRLRWPILGEIYRKIALARIADTLAHLYAAGIPLLEAIGIARQVAGNPVLEHALTRTGSAIREGRGMADAFADTKLFPPLMIRMVRVSESTGALDVALQNVAHFYGRDAEAAIARIEALIEPVLTLTLGALMAWIALSVIAPIYDLIRQFKV